MAPSCPLLVPLYTCTVHCIYTQFLQNVALKWTVDRTVDSNTGQPTPTNHIIHIITSFNTEKSTKTVGSLNTPSHTPSLSTAVTFLENVTKFIQLVSVCLCTCTYMYSGFHLDTQGMAKLWFYRMRDGEAVTPCGSLTIKGMVNELPGMVGAIPTIP